MRKDPDRSQPKRRSARLAKTKRRIDVDDQPSASQNPGQHSASGSEEEQVVMDQVEVVVTPSPDRSDPVGLVEEVAMGGERIEEELSSEDEDNMPSTTLLKYSRFKGDGSQDMDDWLTEFETLKQGRRGAAGAICLLPPAGRLNVLYWTASGE